MQRPTSRHAGRTGAEASIYAMMGWAPIKSQFPFSENEHIDKIIQLPRLILELVMLISDSQKNTLTAQNSHRHSIRRQELL